jgi:hypothetical protein
MNIAKSLFATINKFLQYLKLNKRKCLRIILPSKVNDNVVDIGTSKDIVCYVQLYLLGHR